MVTADPHEVVGRKWQTARGGIFCSGSLCPYTVVVRAAIDLPCPIFSSCSHEGEDHSFCCCRCCSVGLESHCLITAGHVRIGPLDRPPRQARRAVPAATGAPCCGMIRCPHPSYVCTLPNRLSATLLMAHGARRTATGVGQKKCRSYSCPFGERRRDRRYEGGARG